MKVPQQSRVRLWPCPVSRWTGVLVSGGLWNRCCTSVSRNTHFLPFGEAMGQPSPKPLRGLPSGSYPAGAEDAGHPTNWHSALPPLPGDQVQGQRPVWTLHPPGSPVEGLSQDAPPPRLPAQRLYRAPHLFLSLRSSTPPPPAPSRFLACPCGLGRKLVPRDKLEDNDGGVEGAPGRRL